MTEFFDNNHKKIAFKFTVADMKKGLTFFSKNEDFIQVGSWNYDAGKNLLAHIHNKSPREILWTQEVIFVVQGKLKTRLYDAESKLLQEVPVGAQEGMVLLSGGHGYEILDNDTIVLEVKNGPYPGEIDRRRIEK